MAFARGLSGADGVILAISDSLALADVCQVSVLPNSLASSAAFTSAQRPGTSRVARAAAACTRQTSGSPARNRIRV